MMAIQVDVARLTARTNDAQDHIKVDMLNEVAEDFAMEVKKALEHSECQSHPLTISYVTIIPDRNQNIIIKKKFCCPEFDKTISVRIER